MGWSDGAFKYKTSHDGTPDKSVAICQQCDQSMKKHSSTSNLKKHLEVKHPTFWTKITGEEKITPVKNFMSNTQNWHCGSKQCTEFDCSLVRFVVQTNSALNIVDKECFREILHPQYSVPGSTYFAETIQ